MDGYLKPPPYLWPTPKATSAFHTWAVDLLSHLGGDRSMRYLIVAVCPFSKWVEAGPLPDKQSSTVTTWFHSHVVCRYGAPACVRTDRGGEFKGDFAAYLERLGVR